MTEYIEREALLKFIENGLNNPDRKEAFGYDAVEILEKVQYMPAADVAPVRHGRWIFGKDLPCNWGNHPKNKHHLYCSECLEQAFNRSEENDPDFDVDTLYCPNCGAKMDKEDSQCDT